MKILIALLLITINACNGQNNKPFEAEKSKINSKSIAHEGDNGIIYFSFDNGTTWKNVSAGLPQKVSIGLGGVAVSENLLGVATKEYGIYFYNFKDSTWVNVPTEKQIIEGNIGDLTFHNNTVYIGTQHKGIFYSVDKGKTWGAQNSGLNNLTIRRFLAFDNTLYVCTNDGFYAFNEKSKRWQLEYGQPLLQVNGATVYKGSFYIATNNGVYKKVEDNKWQNILPDHSVHNISSDSEQIYAMTYTKLLLASSNGLFFQSAQEGLPKSLYTFNVLNQNDVVFAGQWDGVYSKSKLSPKWTHSSSGLPTNFAATNLKSFKGILVITTSERKLKAGMTIEK